MERSCEFCKFQGASMTEEPCENCIHNAKDNFAPMTHRDMLTAMTDEELAEWLKTEVKE